MYWSDSKSTTRCHPLTTAESLVMGHVDQGPPRCPTIAVIGRRVHGLPAQGAGPAVSGGGSANYGPGTLTLVQEI